MATKIIGSQQPTVPKQKKTRAKDSVMKPLALAYVKENPKLEGKEYIIYGGGLTPKGFLLLKCEEFSVLLPGGTELATTILDEILPALANKKANQMVAILNSGNRFGAMIGTSDSAQVWYVYDSEQESFFVSDEQPTKQQKAEKKLSLEDFGLSTT